jgi:putative oxidoreductase
MFHGWGKIQNPFGWMGPDAFAPSVFQALAAVAEFGGGLALMIGLATPLASLGIACTMAVAAFMHALVWRDPFVGRDGSYELAAVYLCLALLFIATGPGRFSLDSLFFGVRRTVD